MFQFLIGQGKPFPFWRVPLPIQDAAFCPTRAELCPWSLFFKSEFSNQNGKSKQSTNKSDGLTVTHDRTSNGGVSNFKFLRIKEQVSQNQDQTSKGFFSDDL